MKMNVVYFLFIILSVLVVVLLLLGIVLLVRSKEEQYSIMKLYGQVLVEFAILCCVLACGVLATLRLL